MYVLLHEPFGKFFGPWFKYIPKKVPQKCPKKGPKIFQPVIESRPCRPWKIDEDQECHSMCFIVLSQSECWYLAILVWWMMTVETTRHEGNKLGTLTYAIRDPRPKMHFRNFVHPLALSFSVGMDASYAVPFLVREIWCKFLFPASNLMRAHTQEMKSRRISVSFKIACLLLVLIHWQIANNILTCTPACSRSLLLLWPCDPFECFKWMKKPQ